MQLLLYFSTLFAVSAVHVSLQPGECDVVIQDNTGGGLIVPIFDRTAGIGAEFETPVLLPTNSAYDKVNADAAKSKVIAGRIGMNFELTADTVGKRGKAFIIIHFEGEDHQSREWLPGQVKS